MSQALQRLCKLFRAQVKLSKNIHCFVVNLISFIILQKLQAIIFLGVFSEILVYFEGISIMLSLFESILSLTLLCRVVSIVRIHAFFGVN